MGRIDAKVCIVTGAAMGLGKVDAVVLAREGGRVVVTDVDRDAGEATVAELGGDAVFYHHDVRDEDRWREVVASVMDRFGRIDVLVNNAGVLRQGDVETASLEDWRFVNAVNVEGTFLGCKHAIPAMRAGGGGSIVNLSSTAAVMGFTGALAYTASKGAIQAMTRSIAVHCLQRGDRIRCNAIYPHLHESPMALGRERTRSGPARLALRRGQRRAVPGLGRVGRAQWHLPQPRPRGLCARPRDAGAQLAPPASQPWSSERVAAVATPPRLLPLLAQYDQASQRLLARLQGPTVDSGDGNEVEVPPLTDAEYLWEPVAGAWSVRRKSAGPGRGASLLVGAGEWGTRRRASASASAADHHHRVADAPSHRHASGPCRLDGRHPFLQRAGDGRGG